MNRRGAALAVLLLVLSSSAVVDAVPLSLPAFLPPRGYFPERTNPRTKKDTTARFASPAFRETLFTIVNLHTGEALAIGATPAADEAPLLARLLRDRTSWEEHPIDPECLVTVRAAAARFGARRAEIVSGFRSDKLNEMLRKKGRHVARTSQHVLGRAVDFRLVGVSTSDLVRFVSQHHEGGVGTYLRSAFVHVDAGPRRRWRGE